MISRTQILYLAHSKIPFPLMLEQPPAQDTVTPREMAKRAWSAPLFQNLVARSSGFSYLAHALRPSFLLLWTMTRVTVAEILHLSILHFHQRLQTGTRVNVLICICISTSLYYFTSRSRLHIPFNHLQLIQFCGSYDWPMHQMEPSRPQSHKSQICQLLNFFYLNTSYALFTHCGTTCWILISPMFRAINLEFDMEILGQVVYDILLKSLPELHAASIHGEQKIWWILGGLLMSRSVKREILHWSYKSCLGHARVMLSLYQVKLEVNEIASAVNSTMTQSNDQI